MTEVPTHSNDATLRFARYFLTLLALGELTVGVLVILAPYTLFRILLDAELETGAVIVARVAGFALVALGLSWWDARTRPDGARLRALAGSVLAYNLGVGLLFFWYARGAGRGHQVAWLVAILHLAVAALYATLLARTGGRARQ